ncbi:STAS domain-containing protein, partial [bacterium]|nr:STAS domain-containing protein [bacterium]
MSLPSVAGGPGREVLDLGRDHQLAALLHARNNDRLEHRARARGVRRLEDSVRPFPVAELARDRGEVDAHAVGTLQNVLMRSPQPWVLDWSPLEVIDVKAARALLGMFTLWGDQDVELRCLGTNTLRDVLKNSTPSGRRDVEQLWWELRMSILRAMNRADEFELTALDFCVTYEVSPPGWERPQCHFQQIAGDQNVAGWPIGAGRPRDGVGVLTFFGRLDG